MRTVNFIDFRLTHQIIWFKKHFVPPGTRREKWWYELSCMARLYGRDGFAGVLEYMRNRPEDGEWVAPLWWTRINGNEAEEVEGAFQTFLKDQVAGSAGIVLIFTAVPFDEAQGQRATWLARVYARMGYSVLFLLWRWSADEPVIQNADWPAIHQMPLDVFWKIHRSVLASASQVHGMKLFLAEFPHPSLLTIINVANAYNWITVYDIIDDWQAFKNVGQAIWYSPDFEKYLFQNVHYITATAGVLAEHARQESGREVFLVPNAVEPETLVPDSSGPKLERGVLTLGYFGHLTPSWFDWEMVQDLAIKHPDWQVYLIGYGEGIPTDLPANLHWLGKIPHYQLANYACQWDVAMIPFRVTGLAKAVDPIKVYEYLALHLPVVSSGMPHLSALPFTWNAQSGPEFEQKILEASQTPLDFAAMDRFVDQNTWQRRAERFLQLAGETPSTQWLAINEKRHDR